ncbi:hypothetical protein E1264_28990 [Actinomadura sp. KC216]|uniref:hypothetical protein n=1 Tax=Actinomadura sp. KC216 TaxID=2530370 RepID=UPI00105004EC|nr:hypothetical protein [Actinomadura sp. KC216]TDB83308.1 hypothetical protein E1264_28990 [Actinomadura sp. KC216]
MQTLRPLLLESAEDPAPVPEDSALDIRFSVDSKFAGELPELSCQIDGHPVDAAPGRWYIPVASGSRTITLRCGVTASFATEAVKGRARIIQVWIRPGAAVPMVVSAPLPPPKKGLQSWNLRVGLFLLAAFVILFVANTLADRM